MFTKRPFSHPVLALADRLVDLRLRSRVTLLGDRAIFVRRDAFWAAGGFRELAILEDPDLGRRLEGLGRLCLVDLPVTTSERRFLRGGVARSLALMALLSLLFELGLPAQWLARLYAHHR